MFLIMRTGLGSNCRVPRQEKCNIVLSTNFWDVVKDCVSALEPLLIQLRLVNSDDMPALPGVYAGMDLAKKKINDSFANKPLILRRVMDIVEGR